MKRSVSDVLSGAQRCGSALMKHLSKLPETDRQILGSIIGKSGVTINQLQHKHKVAIQAFDEPKAYLRICVLEGREDEFAKILNSVKADIVEILDRTVVHLKVSLTGPDEQPTALVQAQLDQVTDACHVTCRAMYDPRKGVQRPDDEH